MPALRVPRAAPQSPYVQPVIFGGQQGAANVRDAPDVPAWARAVAPPTVGPGGSMADAQAMEAAGSDPQSIFQTTGWYHAPDQQWKWVLSDKGAQLNTNRFNSGGLDENGQPKLTLRYGDNNRLSDILNHPDLFAAYPHLANTTVERLPEKEDNGSLIASYDPKDNKIRLASNRTADQLTSTLLHELQHDVQDNEEKGFGAGGGASEFYPKNYYDVADKALDTWGKVKPLAQAAGVDAYSLRDALTAHVAGKADPATRAYVIQSLNKLPPDAQTQAYQAANGFNSMQQMRDEAYNKYRNLAGETESRQVQDQYKSQNWNQLPTQMPGFAPAEQQIVKTPGYIDRDAASGPHYVPTGYAPGRQYELETPSGAAPTDAATADGVTTNTGLLRSLFGLSPSVPQGPVLNPLPSVQAAAGATSASDILASALGPPVAPAVPNLGTMQEQGAQVTADQTQQDQTQSPLNLLLSAIQGMPYPRGF